MKTDPLDEGMMVCLGAVGAQRSQPRDGHALSLWALMVSAHCSHLEGYSARAAVDPQGPLAAGGTRKGPSQPLCCAL
eukprot:6211810-Pleurochrysis_carterae.AAC.2